MQQRQASNTSLYPAEQINLKAIIIALFFQLSRENCLPEIYRSIIELIILNDNLTTLILENIAVDYMYHNLKIGIDYNPATQRLYAGFYLPKDKQVKYNPNSCGKDIIIHELSHAVINSTFDNFCPYPQAKNPRSVFEALINPAELKFKHCIRQDSYELQNKFLLSLSHFRMPSSPQSDYLFFFRNNNLQSRLKLFFKSIETFYKSPLTKPGAMIEIFSFYMGLRVDLLQLAKDNFISPYAAHYVLQWAMPRVHDFFETDVKRVFKNRLVFFFRNYPTLLNYRSLAVKPLTKSDEVIYIKDIEKICRPFWRAPKKTENPPESKTSKSFRHF